MKIVKRELATYNKGSFRYRNLLIRRDTDRDDLIQLARKLHQEDPKSNIRFFDDDKKFKDYMAWDINYRDPAHPFPEDWTESHYIAMVYKMAGDKGIGWYLSDHHNQPITPLE